MPASGSFLARPRTEAIGQLLTLAAGSYLAPYLHLARCRWAAICEPFAHGRVTHLAACTQARANSEREPQKTRCGR